MTNEISGAFIAGFASCVILFGAVQIGLNIGLRTAIKMLEEYPAAANFLKKNKKMANTLPFIIESNG